jgi:hypothetical protein
MKELCLDLLKLVFVALLSTVTALSIPFIRDETTFLSNYAFIFSFITLMAIVSLGYLLKINVLVSKINYEVSKDPHFFKISNTLNKVSSSCTYDFSIVFVSIPIFIIMSLYVTFNPATKLYFLFSSLLATIDLFLVSYKCKQILNIVLES